MESNLQPSKTRACKEVIVSGRVREVIPQCVNASTPRVCSDLGSVTEVTLIKLQNALAPIVVRVSGSVREVAE